MRIDDDGLRIGITDDTQALMTLKLVEFILKTGTEIGTLQRVDRAVEATLVVECHHTGAFCT